MADPIVLIVDDEPNVIRLCRRLLERDRFVVFSATSPSQALTLLSHQPVDLLLVDIRMPGMDGFELLSLARRHQPDLTAVIMTGYGTIDTAIMALHHGADDLILKPFAGADLVECLRRALEAGQQKRDAARLRALRPLFDASVTLFAETDPVLLEEKVINTIASLLRCPIAILFWLDEASHECQGIKSLGDAPAEQDLKPLLEKELPLLANADGRAAPELQDWLNRFGMSGLMLAAVKRSANTLVFLAAHRVNGPFFREADLELFQILAQQASAAIENARLYAEKEASIQRLETSQQALIQAEKMAAAGRLTASIAHEINNPLQSLHNCLHLAGRKELTKVERDKYLGMAQNELDRLMTTVQRMLAFYRPGARDRKLTNLNDVIKTIVNLLDPQLSKNGISIETTLVQNLSKVMVVPGQIQQVLINLVLNAMEAMPAGGRIVIGTENISSENSSDHRDRRIVATGVNRSSIKHRRMVKITVEDNGPGIAIADRDKIFEPFFSTKENGTGLGLAVSYGIVAAHGGSLNLVEGKANGACFQIILPEDGDA